MNILDEVTIDFDLDSKILCNTPAKLKLRDKTLKGIHFNLNEENGILPKLRLAKKENSSSNVVDEEKEFSVTDLNNVMAGSDEMAAAKKLRVSEEKSEALRKITDDLINVLRGVNESEANDNVVENVTVEAIPEVQEIPADIEMSMPEVNVEPTEMPVIETYSEEIKDEPVIEIPVDEQPEVTEITEIPEEAGYSVEQGDEGVVASVEPVEIPVVDKTSEVQEIPSVSENVSDDMSALERANNSEMFKKNLEIIQETKDLEVKEKEGMELLSKDRERRQDVINISLELDKTHAERQIKITELQDNFDKLVAKQYEENEKRRNKILENINNNNAERQKVQDEISQYEETNKDKYRMIEEAEKEILKYEQLIQSLQSVEDNYNYDDNKIAQFPGANQSIESYEEYEQPVVHRKVA